MGFLDELTMARSRCEVTRWASMLVLAVLVTLELSIGKDADRVIPEEPTTPPTDEPTMAPTSGNQFYEGLLMTSSTREPSMEPTTYPPTLQPSNCCCEDEDD